MTTDDDDRRVDGGVGGRQGGTMSEQVTERTVIRATPERCAAVVADFVSYPAWAADIKEVTVLDTEQGRGRRVQFRAAAFGRSSTYTLAYDFSQAPRVISWKLEEGDLTRVLDGSYTFDEADGGDTEVTYHLVAEFVLPVPGFVKRRAEGRVRHTALKELKARAESAT